MALVCAANSSSGYTGREGEGVKLYSAAAGFKVKLDFWNMELAMTVFQVMDCEMHSQRACPPI